MLNTELSELYVLHLDNKIYPMKKILNLPHFIVEKNEVYSGIINLPKVTQLISVKTNPIPNLSFLIMKEVVGGK